MNQTQLLPVLDFNQPWHITPEAGKQLLGIYDQARKIQERGGDFSALQEAAKNWNIESLSFQREDRNEMYSEGRLWGLRDDVATINVRGPILRYSSWFSEWMGMATTQSIAYQIGEVKSDSRVSSVVFNFDSPGGQALGLSELAQAIRDLCSEKRVVAYVDGWCCSAAYWWASACSEVVTSPLGVSGSIGSVMVMLDDSEYLRQQGLKEVVIKSTQSPKKWPLLTNKQGLAQYQELVDKSAQVFGEAVAEFRNVPIETVWNDYGQGWVMTGQQAVDAGLCDRMGDYESLVSELASGGSGSGNVTSFISAAQAANANGGNLMANENNAQAPAAGNVSVPAPLFQQLLSLIGMGGQAQAAAPAQPAQTQPAPPVQAAQSAPPAENSEVAQLLARVKTLESQLGQSTATAQEQAHAAFMASLEGKVTPAQGELFSALHTAIAEGKATPEMLTTIAEEMDTIGAKTIVPPTVKQASTPVPSPEAATNGEVSPERQAELLGTTTLGQQALAAQGGK